ncbi:hypothetical protein [Georgenia sp. MJ170]|uniref:hypothetical protein n=1 Tax=Georgenia sunbinii TaxID=3117728 RepID=UPI002F26923C
MAADRRVPRQAAAGVVLGVTFLFQQGEKTVPIRDSELAAQLGIAVGDRVPLTDYATLRAGAGRG